MQLASTALIRRRNFAEPSSGQQWVSFGTDLSAASNSHEAHRRRLISLQLQLVSSFDHQGTLQFCLPLGFHNNVSHWILAIRAATGIARPALVPWEVALQAAADALCRHILLWRPGSTIPRLFLCSNTTEPEPLCLQLISPSGSGQLSRFDRLVSSTS